MPAAAAAAAWTAEVNTFAELHCSVQLHACSSSSNKAATHQHVHTVAL
jgi:hypothetical protein